MRRPGRFAGGMALVVLVFLLTAGIGGAQDKVTLAWDWLIYGKMAPFYGAQVLGFFKDEGIDFKQVRGFGNIDTAKRVAAGQVEFGMSSLPDTIEIRTQGGTIKTVSIYMHDDPGAVMFIKGKGIEKPKDLEGKTIGGPRATNSWVLFPVFAKAQGIDMAKVQHINMEAAHVYGALAGNVVDSIHTWVTVKPGVLRIMAQKGLGPEKLGVFKYFDKRDVYNQDMITTEEIIAKKPDVVRRMVRATTRAKTWAIENPEKALEAFWKENPALKATSEAANRDELRITIELFKDDFVDRTGQGFPVREKVMKTQEVFTSSKNLAKEPVEKIYTDEFFKGMPREYMFPKQWTKF